MSVTKYYEDREEAIEAAKDLAGGDASRTVTYKKFQDYEGWTFEVVDIPEGLFKIAICDDEGYRMHDWSE